MLIEISVENIKCGGCANGIKTALLKQPDVTHVEVEIDEGVVKIETLDKENVREVLVSVLNSMGYPEVGSVEGLKAAGAKAKSFVSCAVGKLSKDSNGEA